MKRCLLGCGLIVWDVDLHVDDMHPISRAHFPHELQWSKDDHFRRIEVDDKRKAFVEENFSPVVL